MEEEIDTANECIEELNGKLLACEKALAEQTLQGLKVSEECRNANLEIQDLQQNLIIFEGNRALSFAQAQEVMSGNVQNNQVTVGRSLVRDKEREKEQEKRDQIQAAREKEIENKEKLINELKNQLKEWIQTF